MVEDSKLSPNLGSPIVVQKLVLEMPQETATPSTGSRSAVVKKFIGMWLGSLLVLVLVALMANIEWVRPHLENSLSSAFHRKVRLGRLSWSLGLNGLSVDTNKFVVRENDGQPFIISGPSEIGIAFLPLFQKKLIIKHLDFDKPEVWATKLSSERWNFSDLLAEGPEIHMVQIESGILHLRNKQPQVGKTNMPASENWLSYDLKEIKLTLVLPKKDKVWPAYFACKIPLPDGKTDASVRLSATGKGLYEDWRTNKYSVELDLDKFNPRIFRPLITGLPDLDGSWNLKFVSNGVFNDGVASTVTATINNLKVRKNQRDDVEIPIVTGHSKLLISPAQIAWSELNCSIDDWQLKSNGKISDWQGDAHHYSYEANIGGRFTDLRGLFSNLISKFFPVQTTSGIASDRLEKLSSETVPQGKLQGLAVVELKLTGNNQQNNVFTSIKANAVPLSQLVEASGSGSFLSMLKLDPMSPISGELLIDQNHRIELKDFEIPIERSKLRISGFFDEQKGETHLEFKAKDLSFDSIKQRLGSASAFVKATKESLASERKSYDFEGLVDLDGTFDVKNGKDSLIVHAAVKDMKIAHNRVNILATKVNGRLDYDGTKLIIHNLKGELPSLVPEAAGDFDLKGELSLSDKRDFALELIGHRLELTQLKNVLSAYQIQPESKSFDRLSGRLQEFKLHARQKDNVQAINFTASPADIYVGLKSKSNEPVQQLHLNGGSITYLDNELALRDVNILGRGGKLVVSAFLAGRLEKLVLRSAHIRSDGFELSEFSNLPYADLVPKDTSTHLPKAILPSSGHGIHGRVYGDLQFDFSPDHGGVNGVVGFFNVGGKFGRIAASVEKLTGLVSVSRKQLVFQDIAGLINKSSFSIDGTINDYQTADLTWRGQLNGRFSSEELVSLTEQLGHGIQMRSRSADGLFLRVSGSGTNTNYKLLFNGRADAGRGISLKTAFGTFTQPKDQALTFDGSLSLKESDGGELALHNCSIHTGEDLIQAQGRFKWLSAESERPASLSFSVKTPNPIPANTLLQIVSVDNRLAGVTGSTSVDMSVEGPINDLVCSGMLSMDKVSLPEYQVENLTGKVSIPRFSLSAMNQPNLDHSEAELNISSVKLSGTVLKDCFAHLAFVDKPTPRIVLDSGEAVMSGGKLTLTGYMEPQTHSYHAQIRVTKVIVDQLVSDMMDRSGGVTGFGDLSMTLDTKGQSAEEWIASLAGAGRFNIYQGSVASFGKLQEKLNGANLLQQGIFGFNVNNLLQTMLPVNTGQFKEISGNMTITRGVVHLEQVRFDGNDIRLRAAGDIDLPKQTLDLDIAGDIPRVTASIIPGAFGEMSRTFTLQRLFRVLTFHKLKDLPALPLLGDIANDDPRSFTFKVVASLNTPKQISQSVEKSFHWLVNKPFASAHPVPGM